MRICYVANARIPTEKAHGLQIVKMCEAFARQGIEVELIVPYRRQSAAMREVESLWEYYDVTTRFPIKRLPSPDFISLDRLLPGRLSVMLYMLQSLLFGLMATVITRKGRGVYYTRDWYALFALILGKPWHGKRIFFEAHEMHGGSHRNMLGWLLRRIDGLIVITQALKTYYQQFGVAAERIAVAADGIDERRLVGQMSKEAARTQLGFPPEQHIACYAGHLFRWKGVYTFAEAMRHLSEEYGFYIVGGMTADRRALQQFIDEQQLPRITLVGHVPYHAVPVYLAAADVLILPNSATVSISRDCTSPLKLFEYMGAQRPIVASDLPSLREVLQHERNAYFVTPDNPQALADGIRRVMTDQALRLRLIETAYRDAQSRTWSKRAQRIAEFMQLELATSNGSLQ